MQFSMDFHYFFMSKKRFMFSLFRRVNIDEYASFLQGFLTCRCVSYLRSECGKPYKKQCKSIDFEPPTQ